MNKKDILKLCDDRVQDKYNKLERNIENDLIAFQDENIVLGFKMAMELIRQTPLGDVESLVNSVLD